MNPNLSWEGKKGMDLVTTLKKFYSHSETAKWNSSQRRLGIKFSQVKDNRANLHTTPNGSVEKEKISESSEREANYTRSLEEQEGMGHLQFLEDTRDSLI